MKYIYNLSVILSFFIIGQLFLSCANSTNDESISEVADEISNEQQDDDQEVEEELIDEDSQFIPPSPLQIASIFNKAGMHFIYDLPNSPDLVSSYTSKFKQSVVFGVYSSDLAYCIVNDKYDEASSYLKVIRELGNKIGLETVFQSDDIIAKFEDNIGSKDSIISLLIHIQENTDDYIAENELDELSVIYFSGAWIEGMYLGSKTLLEKRDGKIGGILSEQITIAEIISNGIKNMPDKSDEVKDLLDIIEDIIDTYHNFESVINLGEDVAFIDAILKDDEVTLLANKVIELRNTLIQ